MADSPLPHTCISGASGFQGEPCLACDRNMTETGNRFLTREMRDVLTGRVSLAETALGTEEKRGWLKGLRDAQRECEVVIDEDPRHIAQVAYTRARIQGLIDGTHAPGEMPASSLSPPDGSPMEVWVVFDEQRVRSVYHERYDAEERAKLDRLVDRHPEEIKVAAYDLRMAQLSRRERGDRD